MNTAKQINELLDKLLTKPSIKDRTKIEHALNEITNKGTQIKGVFDNPYYVNTTQRTAVSSK